MCGPYVTPDEAAMERADNLTARQWQAWMDEAYRPVIRRLAGEALQFEQVDDVLFFHAGSVMVDSGAVSAHFC